jgi:hypothetical protein
MRAVSRQITVNRSRFAVIAARFMVNPRHFRTTPDFSGPRRTFQDHAEIFPDDARLFRTAPDFSGQPPDVSGRRRTFQDAPRFFRLTARCVVVIAGFSRRPRVSRRDGARPADRLCAQRPRQPRDAARGVPEPEPAALPVPGLEARAMAKVFERRFEKRCSNIQARAAAA